MQKQIEFAKKQMLIENNQISTIQKPIPVRYSSQSTEINMPNLKQELQSILENTPETVNINELNNLSKIYVDLDCFMKNMKDLKSYSKDLMVNYDLLMSGINSCTYTKKTIPIISEKNMIEKFENSSDTFTTVFVIICIVFFLIIIMLSL